MTEVVPPAAIERPRLWEIKHPYYMTEGCFYSNECHQDHESWEDFMAEWADADNHYNWLIRWDWVEPDDEDAEDEEECPIQLRIQYFMQRKAYPFSVYINVTRDDEPAIYAFLATKWEYMQKMWAPFSSPVLP